MAYVDTRQIADEPILISTYRDRVTVDDVGASQKHIEDFARMLRRPYIYLIIDTTDADATFGDMLKVLRMPEIMEPPSDVPLTSDIQIMMVGTDAMVKFYVNALKQQQYGGQTVPLFAHLDDAIEAARTALLTNTPVNTAHP